ncbi:MAG: hypothetical protein KGZ80_01835 [Methylomonas sp.]|nr:hypothetical protein [Methylomonas sp.]PPD25076.1 MAG: hypothetical protein CTY22_09800 [Methylomonas sp.]PPD34432.1 MAG: hypothetical protein CTY21_09830 [Methylomonas sp.]PPD38747.1 MAG: hypothetical protein CTY17_08970 [Methylomonas sp.]PPD54380.1 MAG: hypothetical protein CTY11_03965 [Methylomonas sp.]
MKKISDICFLAWLSLWMTSQIPTVWADSPATVAKPVETIALSVVDDNREQFGFDLVVKQITERVRSNLAEWDFPVKTEGQFSHNLQARLGKTTHRETPVGFSFSRGNSDPRAADFQKADVLPVTCTLSDAESGDLLVQRESSFISVALDKNTKPTHVVDKLVDQIGTVCLDVLQQLPVPKSHSRVKATLITPKWVPEVRVEVRETPAAPNTNEPVKPATPVTEPKREIVIHNQGTPVIFNFGFERK